jgi:predicted ATP-dependent endonuclease of OLD family
MKIEQLTVENFKCFKREQTFDFSRLTILTGANSSGKSSVMYSILMALQSEDFPYQLSPNGMYVNLGDFKEIANTNEQNSTILISLKIKDLELNGHFLPPI